MAKRKLSVLEYAEYPGPRYMSQGSESGEDFYLSLLNKKFTDCYKNNDVLILELDGTAGYPSSFLDEAVGELVYDFTLDIVREKLEISTVRFLNRKEKLLTETYPLWEKKRKNREKVTHSVQAKGREVFFVDKLGSLDKRTIE